VPPEWQHDDRTAAQRHGGHLSTGTLIDVAGDVHPVRWWVWAVLLALAAVGFDGANRIIHYGPLSAAPLDGAAHLATAALALSVLARLISAPGRFYVAALIASVAIDLDHIPDYLGLLGDQNGRPFTHSLTTVAVVAGAAAASRRHRAVLAGTAAGLLVHFARDIVEGPPGVRMLWPVRETAWTAGYWWFLAMIILLAAAWLVLAAVGVPHGRWRVFQPRPEPL
jgi:membrane-bound metal-dependent hydrolase YbcI (DUF457 family)